ncbi:hypothetical protein QOZ80_9AG0685260 [Eleusine coracana subsp. coracana]|nr:hypothetical protein QOZ80_9AG0685260 [Eleusine coracana subsp. coracana]
MINNATTNYNTQFYPVQLGCEYDGLENYKLVSLSADMKGQRLDYDSIYRIFDTNMVSIDLSSNNLTGIIPDEIGTLDALVNLNLARNHLTGCVASTVGTMQSLESLDLSRNNFSCEIPTSLANLTFLSYLDLSYNNFTGRIPSGAQLDTLYDEHPFMYDENIGLCGDPVKKKCSSIDVSKKHLEGSEEVFVMDFFYLGLGCGFTAGIWIVFCAILFNERWRISCFCVFDMLYDKANVLLVHTWARLTSRKKLVIS